MNSELYDSIVRVYRETRSVLETARRLNTYPIKVRRVLLTEGLWASKRSRSIAALMAEGKKISEIAEKLDMNEKNVQAYLPYTKGEYGKIKKSKAAINAENYRKRNLSIVENRIGKKDADKIRNDSYSEMHGNRTIMKLHLELKLDDLYEKNLMILKKYGKIKEGISRDILVPSDLTLWALHYIIQRAFGWEEGSLHSFELDKGRFLELIRNRIDRWCSFCGLYFRFPIPCDCYFWNEDYVGDISYKSWLRRQYTGPYRYGGTLEHFAECRGKLDRLIADNPFFKDIVFNESDREWVIPGTEKFTPYQNNSTEEEFDFEEMVELLERLSVGELLYPIGNSTDEDALEKLLKTDWTSKKTDPEVIPIADSIYYLYWGEGWRIRITCMDQYDFDSGVPGFEDKTELLKTSPLCIGYDGLPLLESGYPTFLEMLHSREASRRDYAREWAREKGWTGYMVKPENLI